jgi:hypothetical protein
MSVEITEDPGKFAASRSMTTGEASIEEPKLEILAMIAISLHLETMPG